MEIPGRTRGLKFSPTDQDLISILESKIKGEPVPAPIEIKERNLYGSEEPWKIFQEKPSAMEMYFFTQIKKKYDSGKKIDRVVGNGTWKIQNTKKISDDSKANEIGLKKTLNFIEGSDGTNSKKSSWIMHEYILIDPPVGDQGRWAICRIKRGRGNLPTPDVPPAVTIAVAPLSVAPLVAVASSSNPPMLTLAPAPAPAPLKRPAENDGHDSGLPKKKKPTTEASAVEKTTSIPPESGLEKLARAASEMEKNSSSSKARPFINLDPPRPAPARPVPNEYQRKAMIAIAKSQHLVKLDGPLDDSDMYTLVDAEMALETITKKIDRKIELVREMKAKFVRPPPAVEENTSSTPANANQIVEENTSSTPANANQIVEENTSPTPANANQIVEQNTISTPAVTEPMPGNAEVEPDNDKPDEPSLSLSLSLSAWDKKA